MSLKDKVSSVRVPSRRSRWFWLSESLTLRNSRSCQGPNQDLAGIFAVIRGFKEKQAEVTNQIQKDEAVWWKETRECRSPPGRGRQLENGSTGARKTTARLLHSTSHIQHPGTDWEWGCGTERRTVDIKTVLNSMKKRAGIQFSLEKKKKKPKMEEGTDLSP